jgi:predicted phosphodiesterase
MVLGILLLGRVTADLGPFQARFSVVPTFSGGTTVEIPPLGSLKLHSHLGPVKLVVHLQALEESRARALVNDPNGVATASETIAADLDRGVRTLAVRTAGAGLLGALVLSALVYRSMRRVAASGCLAVAVVAASGALATATFRPDAIEEPTYEGLLTNAPAVIGDARRIADQYEEYRAQLQRLVQNVSRLYSTFSALPVYESDNTTTRVLHISDLHLNPAAWSVVQTIVKQFDVKFVVDTGDLTDWGSEPEASYVESIAKLKVPYVYIRGNHDSVDTAAAVARQPNAVVLSNSTVTVAGLTIAGVGDPRFTPDKGKDYPVTTDRRLVVDSGAHLAAKIATDGQEIDLALVHDPVAAEPLAFICPVVLSGHVHRRDVHRLDGPPGSLPQERTLLMTQGSSGGAGLRGLERDKPLPLALTVLYYDAQRVLQAYDDISVGGTGLSEVSLQRHVVKPDIRPGTSPSPSGSSGSGSPSGPVSPSQS